MVQAKKGKGGWSHLILPLQSCRYGYSGEHGSPAMEWTPMLQCCGPHAPCASLDSSSQES